MIRVAITPKLPRDAVAERETDVDLKSINDVAKMLAITPRTLRFYEDRGLIAPTRVGTVRIYSKHDVARMRLILRGKLLGFSLRDIEAFLELYQAAPQSADDRTDMARRCRDRIDRLSAQRVAIIQTVRELEASSAPSMTMARPMRR